MRRNVMSDCGNSDQLAKLAGNKVVATCGGPAKSALLKSLGVDRVIDYHKEDVKSVRLIVVD